MRTTFGSTARRGALIGFLVGSAVLIGLLAMSVECLPYRLSFLPQPWPWFCSDPAYGLLGYLAFPANVLTNDLSRAIIYAPLSLAIYVLLGGLIGYVLSARNL